MFGRRLWSRDELDQPPTLASWRRGSQGRAARPARRGSLDGPGVRFSPATISQRAPLGALACAIGRVQRASPLPKTWAGRPGLRLPCIPSSRLRVHGELRPQPDGHNQIVGLAQSGGHAYLQCSRLGCARNLFTRPVCSNSGPRRRASRNRPGSTASLLRQHERSWCRDGAVSGWTRPQWGHRRGDG
jgi:hypothetical protein